MSFYDGPEGSEKSIRRGCHLANLIQKTIPSSLSLLQTPDHAPKRMSLATIFICIMSTGFIPERLEVFRTSRNEFEIFLKISPLQDGDRHFTLGELKKTCRRDVFASFSFVFISENDHFNHFCQNLRFRSGPEI